MIMDGTIVAMAVWWWWMAEEIGSSRRRSRGGYLSLERRI